MCVVRISSHPHPPHVAQCWEKNPKAKMDFFFLYYFTFAGEIECLCLSLNETDAKSGEEEETREGILKGKEETAGDGVLCCTSSKDGKSGGFLCELKDATFPPLLPLFSLWKFCAKEES